MKKLLLIVNPCAGQKRANKYLTDIVGLFCAQEYDCTVFVTGGRGDAARKAEEGASCFDRLVCIGGDGTFNEMLSGIRRAGIDVPVGYIPAGSTNDFASSLKLPKNILKAAELAAQGQEHRLDIGTFNGRCFSYVASFGAFTEASYSTPQQAKNLLGHLAYILQGIKDLPSIKPIHVHAETENCVIEGDYVFGTVSNSTSIAGIVTLHDELVDMSDGLFELILVKMPQNAVQLGNIIRAIQTHDLAAEEIVFLKTAKVLIQTQGCGWTLDGEYQEGCESIEIVNQHHAVRFIK